MRLTSLGLKKSKTGAELTTQRVGQRDRKQFFAVVVAVVTACAALDAKIPIGGGDDGINAMDLLAACSVVILYKRAVLGLPRRFSIAIAVVCLMFALGVLLPTSGHLVVRSAGAVLVLQAVALSPRFATAVVRGFLSGMVVHVLVGMGGYMAAGTFAVTEQSFYDLAEYRSGFDGLAGALDAPPLSTSGLLRMQGLTGHPNEFAMLAVIAAMIAVRALRSHRNQLISVAVFGGAAMMALSRIAILIMLIGLVFGSGLGGRRVRRGLVILGGAVTVVLALSASIRDRLFDFGDEENAQIRSSGPLDLIRDATIWPDSEVATRHNSLAFMVDVAGLLFGLMWIAALAYALVTIVRPGVVRREWALAGAIAAFFLTEDRIQAPSFLLCTVICAAIMLQSQHWPGGYDPTRKFIVVPRPSGNLTEGRRTKGQTIRARSIHPATARLNSE